MRVIEVTEVQRFNAFCDDRIRGKLSGNFEAKGGVVGRLGEILFKSIAPHAEYFGDQYWQYDYIYEGKRIDVKARTGNLEPQPDHEWAIHLNHEFNKLDLDWFYFVVITKDKKKAWMCGWLTSEEFSNCRKVKAGDRMPQGGKYKQDNTIVLFKQLRV